jgi:hypothetical protein
MGHLASKSFASIFLRRTDDGFKHTETKENHEKQGKAQQSESQSRCKAHAEESGNPEATGRQIAIDAVPFLSPARSHGSEQFKTSLQNQGSAMDRKDRLF